MKRKDSTRRWAAVFATSLLAIMLTIVGCATEQKIVDDGRPFYQRAGYTLIRHLPPKDRALGTSITIYEKDGLLFYVGSEEMTIYKPVEGLAIVAFYYDPAFKNDRERSLKANFHMLAPSRFLKQVDPSVRFVVYPEMLSMMDQTIANPEPVDEFLLTHGAHWAAVPFKDSFVSYPSSRSPTKFDFKTYVATLKSLDADDLARQIKEGRAHAAGADERIAKEAKWKASYNSNLAQIDAYQRSKAAERAAFAAAGAEAFDAALVQPKKVGTTVCSANNRLGYVDQVEGTNLKILVQGRAMAIKGVHWKAGNYEVDPSTQRNVFEPGIVIDPYFLFRGITDQIQISKEPATIWDSTSFWAVCPYR